MSARPYLAYEHAKLAKASAAIVAELRAALEEKRDSGEIDQTKVDEDLRVMAAIAADWRRIADLYAGRAAAPRDFTADRQEKIARLQLAQRRNAARTRSMGATLNEALPTKWRALMRDGNVTREELMAAYTAGEIKAPGLPAYFYQERRLWAIEAMLWHATSGSDPMLAAEITAEWRSRERAREAA